MLRMIFGKLYGYVLGIILSRWMEFKGAKARGQASFRGSKIHFGPYPHITYLIKQEVFACRCLYSCFVDVEKLLTRSHVTSFGHASND
jgi:hypothetical protein